MCLNVDYLKKPPHNLKTVYKVVKVKNNHLISCFRRTKINTGWYKPTTPGDFRAMPQRIERGAIHCWRTLGYAEESVGENYLRRIDQFRYIIKCKVDVKDFIAYGNNGDAAFKKIFIYKSDVDRVLKQHKEDLKYGSMVL